MSTKYICDHCAYKFADNHVLALENNLIEDILCPDCGCYFRITETGLQRIGRYNIDQPKGDANELLRQDAGFMYNEFNKLRRDIVFISASIGKLCLQVDEIMEFLQKDGNDK